MTTIAIVSLCIAIIVLVNTRKPTANPEPLGTENLSGLALRLERNHQRSTLAMVRFLIATGHHREALEYINKTLDYLEEHNRIDDARLREDDPFGIDAPEHTSDQHHNATGSEPTP